MKPWRECPQHHSIQVFCVTVNNTTTSATTVFDCDCYVMSVGLMNPLRCLSPPVVGLSRHQNPTPPLMCYLMNRWSVGLMNRIIHYVRILRVAPHDFTNSTYLLDHAPKLLKTLEHDLGSASKVMAGPIDYLRYSTLNLYALGLPPNRHTTPNG